MASEKLHSLNMNGEDWGRGKKIKFTYYREGKNRLFFLTSNIKPRHLLFGIFPKSINMSSLSIGRIFEYFLVHSFINECLPVQAPELQQI